MTSGGSREHKCEGFDGGGGVVYGMPSFYFMGIHWYWRPADTSLHLNSITRSVDISKPTSVCMTYLCSLSPGRGGGVQNRVSGWSLQSIFVWNGNLLVLATG